MRNDQTVNAKWANQLANNILENADKMVYLQLSFINRLLLGDTISKLPILFFILCFYWVSEKPANITATSFQWDLANNTYRIDFCGTERRNMVCSYVTIQLRGSNISKCFIKCFFFLQTVFFLVCRVNITFHVWAKSF